MLNLKLIRFLVWHLDFFLYIALSHKCIFWHLDLAQNPPNHLHYQPLKMISSRDITWLQEGLKTTAQQYIIKLVIVKFHALKCFNLIYQWRPNVYLCKPLPVPTYLLPHVPVFFCLLLSFLFFLSLFPFLLSLSYVPIFALCIYLFSNECHFGATVMYSLSSIFIN